MVTTITTTITNTNRIDGLAQDTIDENVVCQDVEYQYYVYDLRNG